MEGIIEILKLAWYGHEVEGLVKVGPVVTAAIIGGAASLFGSIFGSSSASKRARRAQNEARRRERELATLERNRQPIINPYSDVTSLQGFITDTSNIVSNPYANLSVATQAAEFQAEEADLSLIHI